jgi:hypothetical protein
MRGSDEQQSQIFSYLSGGAGRGGAGKDHPLVDEVLVQLSQQFDAWLTDGFSQELKDTGR